MLFDRVEPIQKSTFAANSEMLAFMFGWNPPHIIATKIVQIDFVESADKNTYTLTIPRDLEEKA